MNMIYLSIVPLSILISFIYRQIVQIQDVALYDKDKDKDIVLSSTDNSVAHPDIWGTFRSNLYFGMRTKTPNAILTGLVWNSFDEDGTTSINKIRHACEVDEDVQFGWIDHDGRNYGKQVIIDNFHQAEFEILYLKKLMNLKSLRESWNVKIRYVPKKEGKLVSLIHYIGYDGTESNVKFNEFKCDKFTGIIGWTPEHGKFLFGTKKRASQHQTDNTPSSFSVKRSNVWKISDLFLDQMIKNYNSNQDDNQFLLLRSDSPISESNVVALQILLSKEEILEFYFIPLYDEKDPEVFEEHFKEFDNLNFKIQRDKFEERIKKTFSLNHPQQQQQQKYSDLMVPFIKYSLSNLLGGISYFYGDSQRILEDGQIVSTESRGLFTDIPSRTTFPRGFYWDSGFHNILIGKWDPLLSLEIISDWIETIDSDGWIGREQIMGDEPRSKVPFQYIPQDPSSSNPPAIILALEMLTTKLSDYTEMRDNSNDLARIIRDKLIHLFPKLVLHFNWFIKHQNGFLFGNEEEESAFLFRWRGRESYHTLTSGLDDYPRGVKPSQYELHVDMLSWMALMARSLNNLQTILQLESTSDETNNNFISLYNEAIVNLNKYHWDESRGCYSDISMNEKEDSLVFVENIGYVSIFPMLFGLISPDDPRINRIYDILEDENKLWTRFGIRSLAKDDPFYNKGDQYWTGPIWINLNYLILASLKKYYMVGRYERRGTRLYQQLRENLIKNMMKEWKRSGFIWEQYNDITGRGQRSRPFTGWSVLIVLIITEDYH